MSSLRERVLTKKRGKDGALHHLKVAKRRLIHEAFAYKAGGRNFSAGRREGVCQTVFTI